MRALPPPPAILPGDGLALRFETIVPGEPERGLVPYYHFAICVKGRRCGHINLRVEETPHILNTAGHIGFAVDEAHRGQRLARRACLALSPFAATLLDRVIITCDPDNVPSRRTIESLGAVFLGEHVVAEDDPGYENGARIKRRYEWDLRSG